jgi:hypothetical protein
MMDVGYFQASFNPSQMFMNFFRKLLFFLHPIQIFTERP